VSDYDAFVSNFKKQGSEAGDITVVTDPEKASEKMYIAHHGKYAVVSNVLASLKGNVGIKLTTGWRS